MPMNSVPVKQCIEINAFIASVDADVRLDANVYMAWSSFLDHMVKSNR